MWLTIQILKELLDIVSLRTMKMSHNRVQEPQLRILALIGRSLRLIHQAAHKTRHQALMITTEKSNMRTCTMTTSTLMKSGRNLKSMQNQSKKLLRKGSKPQEALMTMTAKMVTISRTTTICTNMKSIQCTKQVQALNRQSPTLIQKSLSNKIR